LDLDAAPLDADYLAGPFEVATVSVPAESLFLRYMRYLRLRTLGHGNAAMVSHLSSPEAARLDGHLVQGTQRLTGTKPARRTVENLLAGVSETRWKVLVQLAKHTSPAELGDISDWSGTVGANRQILMFVEKHFRWVAKFLQSLGTAGLHFPILKVRGLHPSLEQCMDDHDLQARALFKENWAASFQIDVAVVGSPEQIYPHRVALMPKEPLANTIELLILWVAWLTASSTR
jgi:hypothetical protein